MRAQHNMRTPAKDYKGVVICGDSGITKIARLSRCRNNSRRVGDNRDVVAVIF